MFQQLLKKLNTGLTRERIPYMIIGGQAVLVYGEPRLTKDIDIILGIGPEDIRKIKDVVKHLKLKILTPDPETFVMETMVLPVIEASSGIKVDFIFSFTPYERNAIKRAKKIKLAQSFIKFASLEDVIIHKIFAKRERDLEDVKTLLLKNPHYNKKYIIKWLKKFDASLKGSFLKIFNKITREI